MRAPLPGAWFTGPHTRLRIKRHAPPRLPHRVKIRGLQNSGSFLCRSSSRTFSGKSRLACFYNCGLSVTLRLGFLTESKSEDNKKAADFLPFLSAPVVELADTMDLGDVTLMNVFSIVPRRGYSSVKAGSPVFINADQALRSASASSPSQNQRRIK